MKIIDLTKMIEDGMEVYPGDPEVSIEQIHFLKKEGWRLRSLKTSTHTGTHVDAFSHMDSEGETIEKIPIERFIGETVLVKIEDDFPRQLGLAFGEGKLGVGLFDRLKEASPKFVVVGDKAELSVELERKLLKKGILTITDLENMSLLPRGKSFMFYAVPLKIKDGDGSPVRAFAMI
jgi:arylformamidase